MWRFVSIILIILFCLFKLEAELIVGKLWLIVDAPHLDYSSFETLLQTLAKHPRTGCKEGHFGHAWIRLHGRLDGAAVYIEGGHSGDRGFVQPRYVDGLMDLIEHGEPNPIRYLWITQKDGYFQRGSGGHYASYVVEIPLNAEKFRQLMMAVTCYPYQEYALTGNQCVEFIREVSCVAGIPLPPCQRAIQIPSCLYFGHLPLPLWQDACYRYLQLSTADDLECALRELVRTGQAVNVTQQYRLLHPKKVLLWLRELVQKCYAFPERYRRACLFRALTQDIINKSPRNLQTRL